MDHKRYIKIIFGIIVVLFVSYLIVPSIAYTSDSYTGEYILANKIYLNDGGINIVIYFNESSDSTHFLIFEDWDAKHSVMLSNLDVGDDIKITYRDYVFGVRTIFDIEVL